jgi:hypothetical protein
MGKAGRDHALEFYNLPLQSERLATALRTASNRKGEM